MNNLFQKALKKNETREFFLGGTGYFARNRESHLHSYETHITGWVTSYLKENPKNYSIFFNSLRDLIDNINPTPENTEATLRLLLGLSIAYRKNSLSNDKFDAKTLSELIDAIQKYFSNANENNICKEKIGRFSDRIRANGLTIISDAISIIYV